MRARLVALSAFVFFLLIPALTMAQLTSRSLTDHDSKSRVAAKGGDREVAVGSFYCTAGYLGVSIDGTAGTIGTQYGLEFDREIENGADCAAVTQEVQHRTHRLGCATSRLDPSHYGFFFQFVCNASRDRVMNAIGELTGFVVQFGS